MKIINVMKNYKDRKSELQLDEPDIFLSDPTIVQFSIYNLSIINLINL